MSKAHSKNKYQSDATTQGADQLDSNQNARSLDNAGTTNSVEGSAYSENPGQAMDNEGGATQPGQARDVEGENRSNSSGEYDSPREGGFMSKAASLLDSQAVKKNLNLVKEKAQGFVASGKEQLGDKFSNLSDDVKLRGVLADQSIKNNPYAYALGAVGIGFILGRAFSGKGKADLDVLMSTVNKLNLGAIGSMLGIKSEEATPEQPNYNSDQARKIG